MDLPLNPVEASAYPAEDKWVFLFVHLLNVGGGVERNVKAELMLHVRDVFRCGKRSGCQNITLAITSSDGVPCRHGHAPLITTGTLGTDSA